VFYIDDATLIRTIAQFRIDINQAMTPLHILQKELAKTNVTLRNLQVTARQAGRSLQKNMTVSSALSSNAVKMHTAALMKNTIALKAVTLAMQQKTVATNTGTAAMQKQSIMASQWERKLSWFWAGGLLFGGIRAMQSAVSAFSEVESSMVVIERTTNDVTFSLEGMRKELIEVGKQYGHTWETVQEAAIRWTQAGYNMKDVAELTRLSLLGLNVAEMDVNMATQGLISIMAQWSYGVSDLEEVIDKLNKTSDNYAVTTGDLVEALQRSSGAARALGLNFEETVGLITATRVASGRLGKEVGKRLPLRLETTDRKSLKLRGTLIETIRSQAA
jgi:hypothetical protein